VVFPGPDWLDVIIYNHLAWFMSRVLFYKMRKSICGLAFTLLSPVFSHDALLHLFNAYTSLIYPPTLPPILVGEVPKTVT
jgi:hypothetical protein